MTYFLGCPGAALENLAKLKLSDINKQLLDLNALCCLFSGVALISFSAEVAKTGTASPAVTPTQALSHRWHAVTHLCSKCFQQG